jgi:hypothetical protein
MAEDAFEGRELGIGEFLREDLTVGTAGEVGLDLGKDPAEGGGELDEGGVLLGGKIVLDEFLARRRARDRAGPDGR